MPTILVFIGLGQEDHEFRVSLDFVVSLKHRKAHRKTMLKKPNEAVHSKRKK